ncbi:MAG: DUF1592 domain-containing protein [Fuerstiella sp.]
MKILPLFFCLIVPSIASGADEFSTIQPLVNGHCVRCHGSKTQKGDIRLDRLSELDAATFETVYEQLADGLMPPDDQRKMSSSVRRKLMSHVLERAKQGATITAPGFRRLNKREYGNTVRDLLGLQSGLFNPSQFIYEDEIDEGFDTSSESLVISNELLLEYLGAAEKSLRQALFTTAVTKPKPKMTQVNIRRMDGRGGARYINRTGQGIICRVGGGGMVYDGLSTRVIQTPGRYKITVTASAVDRDNYAVRMAPQKGSLMMGLGVEQLGGSAKKMLTTFDLQDNVEQTFTFEAWIDKGSFPFFSFVNGPGKPVTQIRSAVRQRKIPASESRKAYRGPGIRVSKFKIEGPFIDEWPPVSIRTTYDAARVPNLAKAAERAAVVQRFATRAFRREVTRSEISPYLDYLNDQSLHIKKKLMVESRRGRAGQKSTARLDQSEIWQAAMIRTFAAMMGSIDFLYIREEPGELDSFALANRLSYFFWSTMPDAELFALAKSGRLKEASVLKQQVKRLLDDDRSIRFCHSFADQWLSLDELGSTPPDAKTPAFSAYYKDRLQAAMLQETHTFFRHVLKENRSVGDFIDSNYSFLNRGLAKLYGVKFPGKGNEFVRVTFPRGTPRGGLLGHGSILTLTSNGVETSPVERGVWVLADLLGTPPPPPPKEVPALTPDLNGAETVRQLLEKHRSDKACMECHRRMDPLGFALEAYDPIGRFRQKYSKTQWVSTQGNFLGKNFTDVTGLKKILSRDLRPFARNLVIRIAEYAKGRELIATDYATVDEILSATERRNFQLEDLVLEIATSDLLTDR